MQIKYFFKKRDYFVCEVVEGMNECVHPLLLA